jgi:enoyl-CoA hydratase/carnithine racemase
LAATGAEEPLVNKDVTDGVAVLTWNRPERNNTWSVPMEEEYYRLLRDCGDDPAVRVIVVTGVGKSFCPGMDAGALSDQARNCVLTWPHRRDPVILPRSIRKPVIAAINGACAGIGLVAAMNCDLRFASATAKLTTSFSQRGIMAEHGLAWSLPRVVGVSKALDLLFSARVVQGEEALAIGLVDRIYPRAVLMEETLTYARGLAASSSPLAMGVMKQQVYEAQESTHEEARLMAFRWWYDVLREHSDFAEGVGSFPDRRPPRFAPWDPATPAHPAPLPPD